MLKDLLMYLVLYSLPMAMLMAASAPDLEIWPRWQFAGQPLAGRKWITLAWLTLAHLAIALFLVLALRHPPLIELLAWQLVYGLFAWRVGPWLQIEPAKALVHGR